MIKYLILLLFIPNLIIAKIIPLTCNQFYKNPDIFIELESTNKDTDYYPDREYKNHEVVFIFDNLKMTLKSMSFTSNLKSKSEYKYVFYNIDDVGVEHYTHLQRYTHQIQQFKFVNDKNEQSILYDCKIVQQVL